MHNVKRKDNTMKNTFAEMLRHPIATMLIIGSLGTALTGIVAAAKGMSIK